MVATETTNKYPHLKITELLDLIDLSKSTYYDWIKFKKPIDRYFDYDLLEAIRFCFETCGRKTYGAKRVAKHLKTHGLSAISAKKVLKYMKRDGLIPENYEPAVVDKTTIPERKGKYDRKLKAKMSGKQLNKYPLILSGDITEETLDNGHKVYTCAWIDIRTNKVYGLVTAEHKGNALLLKSLECLVDDLGNLPVNTLMIESDDENNLEIEVDKSFLQIVEKSSAQFRITNFRNLKDVSVVSNNESIVQIISWGGEAIEFKGIKSGSTTILISATGVENKMIHVFVGFGDEEQQKIEVNKEFLEVAENGRGNLVVTNFRVLKNLSVISSDKRVAKISSWGGRNRNRRC